jgi:hypothetical protein
MSRKREKREMVETLIAQGCLRVNHILNNFKSCCFYVENMKNSDGVRFQVAIATADLGQLDDHSQLMKDVLATGKALYEDGKVRASRGKHAYEEEYRHRAAALMKNFLSSRTLDMNDLIAKVEQVARDDTVESTIRISQPQFVIRHCNSFSLPDAHIFWNSFDGTFQVGHLVFVSGVVVFNDSSYDDDASQAASEASASERRARMRKKSPMRY